MINNHQRRSFSNQLAKIPTCDSVSCCLEPYGNPLRLAGQILSFQLMEAQAEELTTPWWEPKQETEFGQE